MRGLIINKIFFSLFIAEMGNSNSGGFGSRTKREPVYCDAACLRRVCQEITPPGRKNSRGMFRSGGSSSGGGGGSRKDTGIYVPGPQFQGLMLPLNHYDEVYSKIYLGMLSWRQA